jgi:raffinose/stachyose/melibiose transport system permease protein
MTSTTLTATAQPAQRPSAVPARRKTDRPPRWQHLILIPLAVIWLVPIVMVLGLSLMPPANPQTTAWDCYRKRHPWSITS